MPLPVLGKVLLAGGLQGGLYLKYCPVLRYKLRDNPALQMTSLSGCLLSFSVQSTVGAKNISGKNWSQVITVPDVTRLTVRPGLAERVKEVEDVLSHGVSLPLALVEGVTEPAVTEVRMLSPEL